MGSVIKGHLSRDQEEVKEQVTGVSGGEDSRKMKQQVERQCSQSVLGMTNH